MNAVKLGKFLAQVRNEKGYTQDVLAEKLNVDSKKVSRWECGNSIPDFDTLIDISKVLDVTLYELSICERIKDESILAKTKNKLKSLKDYRLLTWKKKLMYGLAALLGLFFGMATIYMIKFYGKVEIYGIKSIDDNYRVVGYYTKAKDYSIFNISKISFKKENKKNKIDEIIGNKLVNDISIRLLGDDNSVIYQFGQNVYSGKNEFIKYSDLVDKFYIMDELINVKIPTNEKLILQISFRTKDNNVDFVNIMFNLSEKFINKF